MFTPIRVTGPLYEPVTLPEIKQQLRIDGTDQDAELVRYGKAARAMFERETGTTLYQTTWRLVLHHFPCGRIVLPRATPLISVDSVRYIDSEGVDTVWSSTEYTVDSYSEVGALMPKSGETYPSFEPTLDFGAVRIEYKAGIANALSPLTEIDAETKIAILMLIGSMNEQREADILSERVMAPHVFRVYKDIIEQKRVAYAF